MKARLLRTGKDLFDLSPKDWAIYNGVIAFHRVTGLWRYPIRASGDLETMSRRDLIYWMYKAQYPVDRAWRGSGLEAFFEKQATLRWALPADFEVTSSIALSAVGDLMDHPYLAGSAGALYERVADRIFDADISMANLECVVYPQATGAFKLSLDTGPALYYTLESFNAAKGGQNHCYSFMTTANNHSLDCGSEGVERTIQVLNRAGLAFNGTNESEEDAYRATLIERKGIRVGLISHTFGLNARKPPETKPWIVNRTRLNGSVDEVDFTQIAHQLTFCRNHGVDIVVAQLHWGMEHEYYPRPEQLPVARHLAEMGVDIIIGHHPHVVQPMEGYRTRRDPDRVVPIYYSLGNLITPFSHPAFRRSTVARISVAKGTCRDGATRTYVREAGEDEVFLDIDEERQVIRLAPRSRRSG